MVARRTVLASAVAAFSAAMLRPKASIGAEISPPLQPQTKRTGHPSVVTLNGSSLAYVMKDGAKEFHLIAEPVEREFAPGMTVKCWGYNGSTPGPTIEAVEGDRVRILVTNRLPEHTTIHWHGIRLPCGMDGVGGLNQPHIKPGETYAYEFTVNDPGTYMYHPHADEMLQLAVGMMGLFIVHPKNTAVRAVDRDFALLLHEWAVHPGTYRPDPAVMLDFNMFTMNSKVFPAIDPLVAKLGDRVRIRIGNLSMNNHPIHLHGYAFRIAATDGGPIPEAGQWPVVTVDVPVGATRDIEFIADAPGDWAFHCHKSHHTMNAMGHDMPNPLGANLGAAAAKLQKAAPGLMAMGETGMAAHGRHAAHVTGPENTLPMMMGAGPFGPLEMGGMFTVLKVREGIDSYSDPGWYRYPAGTQAKKI